MLPPDPSRRRLDAPRRNGKGAVNSTHPTRPPPPQRINKPEQSRARSRTFPHFTPPPSPSHRLLHTAPTSSLLRPARTPRYPRRRKRHSEFGDGGCSASVFWSPARAHPARRELRGAVSAECDGQLAAVASHFLTV